MTYGQEQIFIEEENLSLSAFYYDSFDEALLPVVDVSELYPVTYFILDRDSYHNKKLLFTAEKDLTFFLNGKLLQRYDDSCLVEVVLADFFDQSDRQLLAFYNESGVDVSSFRVVSDLKNLFANKSFSEDYVLLPLFVKNRSNAFVFSICLLLVFAYLRFVKAQYLYAYFDLSKMLSRQGVEEYIYMNPFTGQSILLMLVCSLTFALGIVEQNLIFKTLMVERYVMKVILIGVAIFLSIFLKQFFLFVLNVIYGDLKVVRVHFFEYIRMFALMSLSFCVLSFTSSSALLWGVVVLLSFWLIWLAVILTQKSRYRKMYLFSYLCGSEIFPILVLLKLLEGS